MTATKQLLVTTYKCNKFSYKTDTVTANQATAACN